MTRVLQIADASFIRREHQLLNRLDVGLSDEGVRVTLVCPEQSLGARRASLSNMVGFDPPGPFVSTRARAERVAEALGRRAGAGDDPVVVHAWGEGCWGVATELADILGGALVIEVWATRLIRRLARLERRVANRGHITGFVLSAPSSALRDAVEASRVRTPVRLVHWGVYASARPRRRDPEAPASVAILATGVDPVAVERALEGVAASASRRDDLLALIDDRAIRRRPALWEAVRDAGLLETATLVANMEAQREAVLEADVLLQPEAAGELRSLTLDALASGLIVIAQRDPTSDTLRGDSPAILLEDPGPRAWERALREALADENRAQEGVEFVRKFRRASDQIAALLRIYSGLATPAGAPPEGE